MKIILSVLGMCFLLFSPITYGETNVESLQRSYNDTMEGVAVLLHSLEGVAEDIKKLNERFEDMLRIKSELKSKLLQLDGEVNALKSCEGVPGHPDHG